MGISNKKPKPIGKEHEIRDGGYGRIKGKVMIELLVPFRDGWDPNTSGRRWDDNKNRSWQKKESQERAGEIAEFGSGRTLFVFQAWDLGMGCGAAGTFVPRRLGWLGEGLMEGGEQMGRLQSGWSGQSLGLTFSLARRPGPLSEEDEPLQCDRVPSRGALQTGGTVATYGEHYRCRPLV